MKLSILFLVCLMTLNTYGEEKVQNQPQIGSLFLMCNDITPIKKFYGETLGVKTVGSAEEGYLDIEAGIHLTYFKGDYELPIEKEWAWQPGYKGGSANIMSWTIKFPEDQFRKVLGALKAEKIESLKENPEWRQSSYWGFTVRDPMGHTVELYTAPQVKPQPPFEWK